MALNPATKLVNDVGLEVKRTFGDEAAIQISDNDITAWCNAAQREINLANKVLKGVATTDVTVNTATYPMTDLMISTIQSVYFDNVKIDFMSFQEAEEYIFSHGGGALTGRPYLWYEWGGVMNLFPIPETDWPGGLKIYYIKEPAKLNYSSDALEMPDNYFDKIVNYCLARAYELDEDSQNSAYKLQQFEEGLDKLSEHDSQAYDVYPRITTLEDDAW